ncbi:MAG: hydroxymethylbilane synthase [Planctomycetota bacterium]|jgi:hydroxymethylbilane synthase
MKGIRIGTRGSDLALTQARDIKSRLELLGESATIEIIRTAGDADQKRPFAQVGAPGLFVREIENALIDGRIDVGVHCYKDLPSDSPQELLIAAMPEREDARDRLLICKEAYDEKAQGLPLVQGSRVGTASARREALVRDLRPDLSTVHLRGNVPTRVTKLRSNDYDAVLLASAGLKRLERAAERGESDSIDIEDLIHLDLDPTMFVPAPSQGALALQVRASDEESRTIVAQLDDAEPHRAVRAERELLGLVDAGCQVPFGAYCTILADGSLELIAALEVEGAMRRTQQCGDDPVQIAQAAFKILLPERTAK